MSILSVPRERPSGDHASARSKSTPDEQGDPPATARLPFAGYDRLGDRQVLDALRDHSQLELEAVESYERSHKSRERVLNKLRYMRGSEPLPGYDALSVEQIVTALESADLATIKRVRIYERKFADRPGVLDEALRVYHRGQATQPAVAAVAYQPNGGTSGGSAQRPADP